MTQFKCIGTLPKNGDWCFLLIQIEAQADVILVVDRTGHNSPMMVIGEKLVGVVPV